MSEDVQAYDPIPDAPDAVDDSRMSLMAHLKELRVRLIWVVTGLVIGTILGMFVAEWVISFISLRLGVQLIAIGPFENISSFFRVSFTVGTGLAMPVIVYQSIAFVAPGLYPNERRNLLFLLPGILLLFLAGASFALFVMLPVATGFLQTFLGTVIEANWTAREYINFVTRIVFWIGVFFETPLVIAFLARAGFVSGPKLLSWWRQAIVVISVIAAMITPTIDPVNMAIAMAPLIVLYFMGVGLAYIVYRPRVPRDFSEE